MPISNTQTPQPHPLAYLEKAPRRPPPTQHQRPPPLPPGQLGVHEIERARDFLYNKDDKGRCLADEDTIYLYSQLRNLATQGRWHKCSTIAEFLVRARREEPNLQLYNALILSNIHAEDGAAWRVQDLLEEMKAEGLSPDVGTCHAVLKVLSVHLDHLLREDILEYMKKRWFQLSEDGWHHVTAALLREGLFEQALERLDMMRRQSMVIEPWLLDMAVFVLCDAEEVEEAYRIMRMRYDLGESTLRRGVWAYLLDKASAARHHEATTLVWMSQVNQGYLNPSSGICLNVLATAAQAGDAAMGTEVFTHLSKRGTAFLPIHYEQLITAYLSADPPDVHRAVSILTIMPLEKLEPTIAQTRSIYLYMRDKPWLVKEVLTTLRDLHDSGRKVSIAILNLLIECYVEQQNLPEAMKVYKLIHTFAPPGQSAQRSFANVETFNLLLKACRTADPPDEQQAQFLVSELLALRVVPTAMTYDRLILVFVQAARAALDRSNETPDEGTDQTPTAQQTKDRATALQLLDWSFRHFVEMQPQGWMPRFGTLQLLAVQLAGVGDERCWDVLQAAEDKSASVEGFEHKGKYTRAEVEESWAKAVVEGKVKSGMGMEEGVGVGSDVVLEGKGLMGRA